MIKLIKNVDFVEFQQSVNYFLEDTKNILFYCHNEWFNIYSFFVRLTYYTIAKLVSVFLLPDDFLVA
jgi:hypothetical protein